MPINVPLPKIFDQFQIREWTAEDAEQIADIEFDPEVKKFLRLPSISRSEFLSQFQPDLASGWAITIHPGHVVAGTIDMSKFEPNPKKRELRILLAKEYRSRGIASLSARFLIGCFFEAEWIEGIVGVVHPDNLDSIALMKKLGFTHTGSITNEQQVFELDREHVNRRQ